MASAASISPLPRVAGLRSDVFSQLVMAVMQGAISEGERLVVQKLAARLGVSATPVREALVELEAAGIIESVPNRGAVCLPFGHQQVGEVYDLRRILEVEATRCAVGRMPQKTLRDLHARLAELQELHRDNANTIDAWWYSKAMDLDRELHDLIACHCGSDRLAHEIGRYNGLMQAFRDVVDTERDMQLAAVADHLAIVDALMGEDCEDAARAMDDHIRRTAEGVVKILHPDGAQTD
jgi:DNA-binding GntR family transcriptional regulator